MRLYHPGLDTTIEVSESAATVHMKKGWVQPDDPSPSESKKAKGLDTEGTNSPAVNEGGGK